MNQLTGVVLSRMKICAFVCLSLHFTPRTHAQTHGLTLDTLGRRLLVGYWHNWPGSPNTLLLRNVSNDYDIVNVAFAVPTTPAGATMRFIPDASMYPTRQAFIDDINILKGRGKKVLIAIGGANDPVRLLTTADVQLFVSSMNSIIATYGFDGMDIDLESQSLVLLPGDIDFRNPTSPTIVNIINGIITLTNQLPPSFILSLAPETATLQGGFQNYSGIWGSYLPVIHALRHRLTLIYTQHYNTGTMFGRDSVIYQPATADFHVAMTDMLLAGFSVDVSGSNIYFPPLAPTQVMIGLPASSSAAGSGYTPPALVRSALNYLVLGRPFGGRYQLSNPNGFRDFRGLMTWSINWDVQNGSQFSLEHRRYLDSLNILTTVQEPMALVPENFSLEQNYPNPFNSQTVILFQIPEFGHVMLKVFDVLGQEVAVLVNESRQPGAYEVTLDAANLPSATYYYRLTIRSLSKTRRMVLLK